jgi:hypothetical protein
MRAGLDTQYLAMTPSQITFTEKSINIITVQNVEGASFFSPESLNGFSKDRIKGV